VDLSSSLVMVTGLCWRALAGVSCDTTAKAENDAISRKKPLQNPTQVTCSFLTISNDFLCF
jgi:hypothetical protein